MTMSIGGVTIPFDEQPDAGAYPFVRQQRWISEGAEGLVGSVQQMTGTDPLKGQLHFTLSSATYAALAALYEAQASGGGPYALINDELPEPYLTGIDIAMQGFAAELNESNRGLPWFDVLMTFEEVVS